MKKLTIGRRIQAAFLIAIGAMAAVGAGAWMNARQMESSLDLVANEAFPSLLALQKILEGLDMAQRGMNATLSDRIMAEPGLDSAAFDLVDKGLERVHVGASEYEALETDADKLAIWQRVKGALEPWQDEAQRFVQMRREQERLAREGEASAALETQVFDAFLKVRAANLAAFDPLDGLARDVQKEVADARQEATDGSRRALGAILALVVAGTAGLIVVGIWLERRVSRTVRSLVAESQRLRAAVASGQLGIRGDTASIDPEFRPIVEGFNETMDAYAAPIRVTSDYVTRIAMGDLPEPITEEYRGDFDLIRRSLNGCIAALHALVEDATRLADAGAAGRLAVRADPARHQGDFRTIVDGMNRTLDAVVTPLNLAATAIDRISRGEIPPRIEEAWHGDFDALKASLNRCIDAVNAVVADATMLAHAGAEGRLATRADAGRHAGDFRTIVEELNRTLDAVVTPLQVASAQVERISQGDLPDAITDAWKGDYATLRESLNRCTAAVRALVGDVNALAAAAIEGDLDKRADPSRHAGEFRDIVTGVNRTLDAIVAPVQEAIAALERLAARDLRARVEGDYRGDHARIKHAVNATADALHDAIGRVARAVEQVSAAASQIASSSQAVATGASEQAAALAETTGALDSVLAMTRQSADHAQHANALAQTASAAASGGSESVGRMQAALEKIRAAAEGTSQIIRDINEIAFQTNLLALNAAVEAARAGEVGRGFAVVAEEVRSLALRSKEAAQKTEALIRDSVQQAGNGEETGRAVGRQLAEIVDAIGKVTDIVGEIAAAAREQSSGIEHVNRAVGEMDKVTQQNAASAEESSSAASELSSQAEQLAEMVRRFELDVAAGRAGAPTRSATVQAATLRRPQGPAAPAARPAAANGAVAHAVADPFPMHDDEALREF